MRREIGRQLCQWFVRLLPGVVQHVAHKPFRRRHLAEVFADEQIVEDEPPVPSRYTAMWSPEA